MGVAVADGGQQVGEEATGEAGDPAGEPERQQLRAGGADRVGGGGVGVVANGVDPTADRRAA